MLRQRGSKAQWLTPRGFVSMPNAGLSLYLNPSERPTHAGRWLT